jgi:dienelactone hydrolase
MLSLQRWLLLTAVIAGLSACVTLERSYSNAALRLPENVFGDYARQINEQTDAVEAHARSVRKRPHYPALDMSALGGRLKDGRKLPVVIYFHGCAGILNASINHIRALSDLDDFVIVAPDSFASSRPEYCFANHTVDLSVREQVTALRMSEISLALSKIAILPWVDTSNIFLMGHSQGGGTVAGYRGNVQIRGRILLNGACSNGIGGDGMSASEALLTLDTGRDPWFRRYASYCRDYVLSYAAGQSIYEADGATHDLAASYWPEILEFITKNRK